MKKIAKYFFAALATMAAMSCVKELNVEKPVELTGKAYEFTATIGDETKTTLDAETMTPMWLGDRSGNEYITVMEPNNLNTYVAEGIYEPTAEVTFVMAEDGGAGLTGKSVFAVSPAEAAVNCFNNADSVGVTVNYNQIQYAYPETYDPAGPVAVAYNADVEANPHFSFKNASALLKFRVMEGSQEVTSVKFYSLGGEPLAGQMTLMEKGDSSMIVPAKGASNWVEIRGLYESPLDQDVDYYIAVAPALLKKGVGFQFNDGTHVETFTIEKEINIERNKIYDLGLLYYESNVDDKWYLVGNDASASNGVGTFSSMMFQAEGNNLVARNVTFAEKQSFRILNPAKKVSYYANAAGKLEADTWIDLTEEASYAYYPEEEGTYDVYVDYVDGVITGVALVTPGEEAPEYLTIEGMTFTYKNEDGITEAYIFDGEEVFWVVSYDESMADAEVLDPSMIGNWAELGKYVDATYEPISACSGYVKFCTVQKMSHGPLSMDEELMYTYYILKYSNLTETTVDFYSPGTYYENGAEISVYDESGNPVGTYEPIFDDNWNVIGEEFVPTTYNGIGLFTVIEDWQDQGLAYNERYAPVTVNIETATINVAYPVPTGSFEVTVYSYDEETYEASQIMYLLDLGSIEEGVLTLAECFSIKSMGMDAETLAYYHFWGAEGNWGEDLEAYNPDERGNWLLKAKYSGYSAVPTGPSSGVIYFEVDGKKCELSYDNYMYNNIIAFPNGSVELFGTEEQQYGPVAVPESEWFTPPYNTLDIVEIAPIDEVKSDAKSPDGAQWFFNWEDMYGALTCLDFGKSIPEHLAVAYDMAIYGEENLPAEMIGKYMYYMGWAYEIEASSDDETSGTIYAIQTDHFGDVQKSPIAEYTDYNGISMSVTSDMLYLEDQIMFVGKPVELYVEGGASPM